MRLLVLHVPGCPGAETLVARLAPLLAARPDIEVAWQVVMTEEDARRFGMTGSPTILADGADPFPVLAPQPSLACRLYPGENAHLEPAPLPGHLAEALGIAGP
jgi:hypothetical protein